MEQSRDQGQETNIQISTNGSKKKLIICIIVIIVIVILTFLVIFFRNDEKVNDNIVLVDDTIVSDSVVEIDSDSDGLLDSEEYLLGTDKFKSDTDNDGYSDLAEIENGYNPSGEGKISEELSELVEEIISRRNRRLLNSFIEKYDNSKEYSIEYEVYIASEERSYLRSEGESSCNTKTGSSFVQKTYRKGNDFKTDNDGSRTDAYKVFFTFNGDLVNNLEELYIDNQYISCGGGICQKNDQRDFLKWDWKFFQNPNIFYNYLSNNDYVLKHLESSTSIAFNEEISRAYYNEDEVKRKYYSAEELEEFGNKCERFRIVLNEKIYIENINFLNEDELRKAEVDMCIDNDTGAIVYLSVLAQSDAKGENKNILYDIISWNAHIGTMTANSDDILQKGRYTLIEKAWDKNEAIIIIEPYVSNYVSGSIKFFDSDNAILKEIKLDEQNFTGQEKKKLIIEHNLNLEKEIKYELCIDDYCKVIEPSIVSKDYNCLKSSLDKINCEKVDGCFYDNDLCLKFECTSILVKDKKLCEENGCYWIEDDGHDRCFDYLCEFNKDESLCNESEDCVWSNLKCVDKKCYVYEKKETCEASSLKCFWNGLRCGDFYCLRLDSKDECVVNDECSWKIKEGESEGMCKEKNKIEGNVPECPYFEKDDCDKEELCLWKDNQCFYNVCNIHTNVSKFQCEENEKCYWEAYGSCVDG